MQLYELRLTLEKIRIASDIKLKLFLKQSVYFLIFHEKAIGVTVFPGGGKPYLGNVAFFLGIVSGKHHRGEL